MKLPRLRFYPRQTLTTVSEDLETGLRLFGGVPHELLFDQVKSVILVDQRHAGGKLFENAEFLRCGAHWGFRIGACRYRAKTADLPLAALAAPGPARRSQNPQTGPFEQRT